MKRYVLAVCAAGLIGVGSAGTASAQPNSKSVAGALDVGAFAIQELELPAQGRDPFTVMITLGGRNYPVTFVPCSVRGPNFRVLVQQDSGQLVQVEAPPEATYRGSIVGVPDAAVAGSLEGGQLTAMIRMDNQTWNIQPLPSLVRVAPAAAHVISTDQARVPGPWSCAVNEPSHPVSGGHVSGPSDSFLTCQIAVDADNEFFVLNSSSVAITTADITSVINAMAAIYQADANVTFQVGTVIVRQSATQPYTSTDSNTLLTQFQTEWNTNQGSTVRDTAHLFTGKDLDGNTIGLAYVGAICSSSIGYGLSQSRFSGNFSFRVGVTAHEVGHNFNASHCDSVPCSPCRIMCSSIGGCSGSVTSFGCSASLISSYALTRTCLAQFNNGLALPFLDSFPSTTLDYNLWPTPANSGAVVNASAVNERSGTNSLNLANAAAITTAGIDLTATGGRPVFVSFWSEHRGVENGKTIAVAYRRPVQNDFQPLTTLTSNGADQSGFVFTEVVLPAAGLGANAAIRFTAQGNQADDNWYLDDVGVSQFCRLDLNRDGLLNILDYRALIDGFAANNLSVADWNGDGILNVADFNAFVNDFAARCTGY